MKKLIIILFVLFITSFKTQAQGNLQFNQVKLVTVGATWLPPVGWIQGDTLITVPVGKVWKIESGTINNSAIYLDGKSLYTYPFWLPSGTYTLSCVPSNLSFATALTKITISLIEFNITQ